jgi:hypothetical protein
MSDLFDDAWWRAPIGPVDHERGEVFDEGEVYRRAGRDDPALFVSAPRQHGKGVVVFDEVGKLTPEVLASIERTTTKLGQTFTDFGRACDRARRSFEVIASLTVHVVPDVRRIVASQRRRRRR